MWSQDFPKIMVAFCCADLVTRMEKKDDFILLIRKLSLHSTWINKPRVILKAATYIIHRCSDRDINTLFTFYKKKEVTLEIQDYPVDEVKVATEPN
jgi:hypothetical protein